MNHDHSPFLLEFWERKQLDTCSAAKGIAYVLLICIGRQKPNWTSHQRTIFPCEGSTFRFSCNWIWRRQCFSLTKLQWVVTSSLIVHREQRVTEDSYEVENIRTLFILQGYFLSAEPRCTAQTGPVVQRGDLDYRWLKSVALYVYELQPKFTAMESSIRGVSIFWKLSWGLENDNTLFKNDNVCLCWSWSSVILCLTAQVIQCISYERSKRQNLFLSIDVWWWFAFGSHFGSDICWSSMYPVAMHQVFLKTTLRLSKQKGFP